MNDLDLLKHIVNLQNPSLTHIPFVIKQDVQERNEKRAAQAPCVSLCHIVHGKVAVAPYISIEKK